MKHAIKMIRGFTLVELLVVMSIIALLMTLLVPTITKAFEVVRKYRTLNEFKELGIAIQSFRNDWGDIPPSRSKTLTGGTGEMTTGAANLPYYLLGPGGSGWGTSGGGAMPFAGAGRPTRAYGPYYQVDKEYLGDEKSASGSVVLSGFLDAFKEGYWKLADGSLVPRGRILYFKYDAAATAQSAKYSVADNGVDVNGQTNFADQNKFIDAVIKSAYVGIRVDPADTKSWNWPRADYLLISPGPDGRYGYAKTNSDGTIGPALSGDAGATCDDIFNW